MIRPLLRAGRRDRWLVIEVSIGAVSATLAAITIVTLLVVLLITR